MKHEILGSTVATAALGAVVSLMMTTACASNSRPTLSPTKMAEFWQEPVDAAQRDLFNGGGLLSTRHTESDIDFTLTAFSNALTRMTDSGYLA